MTLTEKQYDVSGSSKAMSRLMWNEISHGYMLFSVIKYDASTPIAVLGS